MELKAEYILGVKVNTGLTPESVVEIVDNELLKDNKNHYICTTNPEFIMEAQTDPQFKQIINDADLSVPDGIGVLMANDYLKNTSNYTKGTILYPFQLFLAGLKVGISAFFSTNRAKTRIDGASLVRSLLKFCSDKHYSVFLLGGRPRGALAKQSEPNTDIAVIAAEKIRNRYPNITIVGASSSFNRNESDDTITVDYIKQCMTKYEVTSIDFLFVAYNHNYQEKWILRNAYKINARVSVGVGASLDYIAGYQRESPAMISKYSLGWLFRAITQPWRIKRILTAFPLFPMKVFTSKLRSQ